MTVSISVTDLNDILADPTLGWVVVPRVLSEEVANQYANRAYSWVEGLGSGFDRNDPSTRTLDKLHYFIKGGLTNRYGVAHEQFVWDVK